MIHFGDPGFPNDVFVQHGYAEQIVDLGETRMNHAVAGPEDAPSPG
jgi:hypothetical protein